MPLILQCNLFFLFMTHFVTDSAQGGGGDLHTLIKTTKQLHTDKKLQFTNKKKKKEDDTTCKGFNIRVCVVAVVACRLVQTKSACSGVMVQPVAESFSYVH